MIWILIALSILSVSSIIIGVVLYLQVQSSGAIESRLTAAEETISEHAVTVSKVRDAFLVAYTDQVSSSFDYLPRYPMRFAPTHDSPISDGYFLKDDEDEI